MLSTSQLHTRLLGEQGPLVAFCHGLFGQGKNWTTIAKELATDHRVLLIDRPTPPSRSQVDEICRPSIRTAAFQTSPTAKVPDGV